MKRLSRCIVEEIDACVAIEESIYNRDVEGIVLKILPNCISTFKRWGLIYNIEVERKQKEEGNLKVRMLEPYGFFTYSGARKVAEEVKSHYSDVGMKLEIIEIQEANSHLTP